MGNRTGEYWDLRECSWVRCPQPEALVPAQAEPVDETAEVASVTEADVRSG